MKQTFFFLIVLTICGSLTKAPTVVLRCGTQIKSTSYLKGKVIHIDTIATFGTTYGYTRNFDCNLHKKPITFSADSTRYEVNFKK